MGWLISATQDITADATGVAITLPSFPDDQGTVLVVISNTELAGGESAYLLVDSDTAPNGLIVPAASQRQWEIYCNAGTSLLLATAAATAACKVNVGLGAGVTPLSNDVSALSVLNAIDTVVDSIETKVDTVDTVVDTIAADVDDKAVGRTQYASYTNASLASNAGATTVLTCTTAGVRLDSVAIESVAAAHGDLTSLSLAVVRGAVTVRTLITTVEGAAANFAGAGNQVRSQDCVYLTVGDLIVLTAAGTGAGACSVKVHASCTSTANGGYLA